MNEFEMVPVAPTTTGIAFVCMFHMGCISVSCYTLSADRQYVLCHVTQCLQTVCIVSCYTMSAHTLHNYISVTQLLPLIC